MKTLPNGVTVFNATPHVIAFWEPDWNAPIEVETDVVINAHPVEKIVARDGNTTFVHTTFVGSPKGEARAIQALRDGADVVIGSIVAAQAYPGLVVGMTPAQGYERVGFVDPLLRECLSALEITGCDIQGIKTIFADLIDRLTEKVNQPSKRMNPNKFTTFEIIEVFE